MAGLALILTGFALLVATFLWTIESACGHVCSDDCGCEENQ